MKTEAQETAEAAIQNLVYAAIIGLVEKLERAAAIRGNGHHLAQKIAGEAAASLGERWQVRITEGSP